MDRRGWTRRDGPRRLGELVAWEGLEPDGMLRTTDGALAVTLELQGADPAVVADRVVPWLPGDGWVVHGETVRLPAAGGDEEDRALRTVYALTLTRLPLPARRQAVGRRRAGDLLGVDLQRQGEMERRVREVRRRLADRCAARRLDGRGMLRHLHAVVTGWRPGSRAGGTALDLDLDLDALLALPVRRDVGGVRSGEVHVVPVTVAGSTGRLLADLGDPALPHRAVRRRSVGRLAALLPPGGAPLSVRRLVASLATAPPDGRPRVGPTTTGLFAYGRSRTRARTRAAALVARLRDAGVAARVEGGDPLAAFLASLPARGAAPPA